jgi:hypothetical protein
MCSGREGPPFEGSSRLSDHAKAMENGCNWPASARSPACSLSHFGLLRHFEGVVHLNAERANGALELAMPEY